MALLFERKKDMSPWLDIRAGLLRALVVRIVPGLLAALLGTLLDAGLLDGELGQALLALLK